MLSLVATRAIRQPSRWECPRPSRKSRVLPGEELTAQSRTGAAMLEHLGSREFEEYCQLLLTCLYRCKVELTKRTGDEGRDLLVHKPTGLEVVECKHWPDGTVGRPAVQKLHSATLTVNSRQAAIITTGRFSKEAEIYAKNLGDVKIELIDAFEARSHDLAHLPQRCAPP